jgi:hypothetical protein
MELDTKTSNSTCRCRHKFNDANGKDNAKAHMVMRVNSANVLDEGLRIGGRGRRMNSKVKIRQTRRGSLYVGNKHSTQLAQSRSIPSRPLLAPLYRWSGLEDPVGSNTNYNVCV